MNNAAVLGYLHVEREIFLEPMLPINFETQKVYIEFLRFRFVEDAKNRCRLSKAHRFSCCSLNVRSPSPRPRHILHSAAQRRAVQPFIAAQIAESRLRRREAAGDPRFAD